MKPNNFSKYLFVVSIFILSVVVIFCSYLLKNSSKNLSTHPSNLIVTPTIAEVITSTTSPDGNVICYQNKKYFIALKNGQSENSRILVKTKNNENLYNGCSYNFEKSDFEIVNFVAMILDLDDNFLLTDTGTGPGMRVLDIYDLSKKTKIYEGPYSSNTKVEILDNSTISFWEETSEKPTESNCPELTQFTSYGLGSAIEEKVNLNLITLDKEHLKEYRCSARQ